METAGTGGAACRLARVASYGTAAQHRKGHQEYHNGICAKFLWKQFTNSRKLAQEYCEHVIKSTWCPKRGDM